MFKHVNVVGGTRTAGHGGSVRDLTGDEEDAKDETMIPVDYAKAGQIKDDEILATVRHRRTACCVCVGTVVWGSLVPRVE